MTNKTRSDRLDTARSEAREYAEPRSAGARRTQIANTIDELVGEFVWDGARHRMSWPREIAELAGSPGRHLAARAS